MKTIHLQYSILITLFSLFFSSSYAQISKAEIRATGLTCSMCSNAINKQLKSMPEVSAVTTDLNTNTFTVVLKAGNTLTPSAFKEKVEQAGFFIGSLVLTVSTESISQKPYIQVKPIAKNNKQVQIKVLDKGYVTEKEFKKLGKTYQNLPSLQKLNESDFHIIALN